MSSTGIYLSHSFSWSKKIKFENRKFWKQKILPLLLFKRICTSKKSYLQGRWNLRLREYEIYSVFLLPLLQNLHTKYSCQQHFSRTSTIWFLLMLLICFICTIEYKLEERLWNSALWSILGLLFSKISYFISIFA